MEIMNTMFKGISNTSSPPNKEVQVEHDEAFWSMLMAQMMPMTQTSSDIQPMIVQEQSESVLSITLEGNSKINTEFIEPITVPMLFQTLNSNHENQTVIELAQPIEENLNPVNLDVNIQLNHQDNGQVRLSEVQPLEHQTRPINSDIMNQLNQSESVLSSLKEIEVKPGFEHKVIREKSVMNIPVEIQLQEETKPAQDFRNVISKMMVEKSMTQTDVSSKVVKASEFEKKIVQSDTKDPSQVVEIKMVQIEPVVKNSTSEIKSVDLRSLNELELNQTIKQMIHSDKKEMIIKLKPEGIGEIVIKLSSDNKVDIKFNVINAEVLSSLEKQLPHLHVSLKDYNVMIETSLNFNHQQKEHQREHSSTKHHHSILNHDVETSVIKQPTLSNMNAINRYA